MIQSITITLYNKTQTGTDPFNKPVYTLTAEPVENVLVAPASSSDVVDETKLDGRTGEYQLAIPKGDTHNWENAIVEFFGHKWQVIGIPEEGIDANIPLIWNKKLKVERYGKESNN